MNNKKQTLLMAVLFFSTWLLSSISVNAQPLDRIVAIVEDDVILDRELTLETMDIVKKLEANKVMVPPPFVLRKQVLERLIVSKLQRQLAAKSGIRVTDEMLRRSIVDIARRNELSVDEFRNELKSQGMNFQKFQETIRNEIIVNQLRAREVGSRIKVTDREVEHYLETQGASMDLVKYNLGHILISVPEAASSSAINKAKKKAEKVIADLRNGADFKQTAVAVSQGGNALKGGDLGWRSLGEVPTLFGDIVTKMDQGAIADLIRSPSGFHIVKMLELKGLTKHIVTKTKVRHILIKTNELIDDKEAKRKLLVLKERIIDADDYDDFAALARSNSDDKGSAINGGKLNWVGPGDLVPAFEKVMNELGIDEISDPVQTQFGWHIIQVQGREERDNSAEHKKDQIKNEIRKGKIEEETELWLRRLRDEAFVDINLDRL